MTLPSNGTMTSQQLKAEFGIGSGPLSSNQIYRGGSFILNHASPFVAVTNKAANVPTSGVMSSSDFYDTEAAFEYALPGSGTIQYTSTSIFGTSIYTSPWTKRLTVTGTQRRLYIDFGNSGRIEIYNHGEIQGYHAARNSGAGYPALYNYGNNVHLWNYGAIRGSGGGGGRGGTGGTGGTGSYTTNPVQGPFYGFGSYEWRNNASSSRTKIFWNGSLLYNGSLIASFSSGGYFYTIGSYVQQIFEEFPTPSNSYYVQRSYTQTHYTSGGAGGSGGFGGHGQGWGVAAEAGSVGNGGSWGGTNAGSGGFGGSGGSGGTWATWGGTGGTGATGNSGNHAGGAPGAPGATGGAPGAAILNSRPTIYVTGTIQGSY